MAIYCETLIRKKLPEPIQFYGGFHHHILTHIDTITISLGRCTDGFYLMASASNNSEATDYTLFMNLNDFDTKVAQYHRMANLKIRKLMADKKVLAIAQKLVQKVIDRIGEYKEARNDNY